MIRRLFDFLPSGHVYHNMLALAHLGIFRVSPKMTFHADFIQKQTPNIQYRVTRFAYVLQTQSNLLMNPIHINKTNNNIWH